MDAPLNTTKITTPFVILCRSHTKLLLLCLFAVAPMLWSTGTIASGHSKKTKSTQTQRMSTGHFRKSRKAKKHVLSKQEREILQNLELLQNFDLLKRLEFYRKYFPMLQLMDDYPVWTALPAREAKAKKLAQRTRTKRK